MLSKYIKKLIITLCLVFSILCGSIIVKASSPNLNPFQLSQKLIITYSQKEINNQNIVQTKGKILVYSTHTCEKNITLIAEDLSQKLRNKGWDVEHNTEDFTKVNDYNNAYANSKRMLQTKDLSSYTLVLDIHADATENPIVDRIQDKNVAKIMIPTTSENPNLPQEIKIINGIKSNMKEFSNSMIREETTHYKRGIDNYNLSMSPNMLLIEIGSDKSTLLECKLSNTYTASCINSYLMNNK